MLGTSGNFSVVVKREPMRLAITPSGVSKGALTPDQILEIDEEGAVIQGCGQTLGGGATPCRDRPRAGADAVLHTHSLWSTLLSDEHAAQGGIEIEGYEMLKGLAGVSSHEHREWIPILENDQDMARLGAAIRDVLSRHPTSHAFLLRRHGMYTWGSTLAEALRHVEIVEFLLEAVGRAKERGGVPWRS